MIAEATLTDCKRAGPYILERRTKIENFETWVGCSLKLPILLLNHFTKRNFTLNRVRYDGFRYSVLLPRYLAVDSGQKLAQPDSMYSNQLPVMHAAKSYEMAKCYGISIGASYCCDYFTLVPSALELS